MSPEYRFQLAANLADQDEANDLIKKICDDPRIEEVVMIVDGKRFVSTIPALKELSRNTGLDIDDPGARDLLAQKLTE